jgi:F0F1-type ATP synthase assembly protein I
MPRSETRRQEALRTILIVLVGQVGCVTLLVIMVSVLAGLWLDAQLHTKPVITLALLLAGIPLSVLLMLQVARRTLARLVGDAKMIESAKEDS